MFLLKLELERLSRERSASTPNGEKALQVENRILKERLNTIKDNMNIITNMHSKWRMQSAVTPQSGGSPLVNSSSNRRKIYRKMKVMI